MPRSKQAQTSQKGKKAPYTRKNSRSKDTALTAQSIDGGLISVTSPSVEERLNSLQLCMEGIQKSLSDRMDHVTASSVQNIIGVQTGPQYSLSTAYGFLQPGITNPTTSVPGFAVAHSDTNGVPADLVASVDVISPSIKKDIILGKDINLACLLISGFNEEHIQRNLVVGNDVVPLRTLTDSRLSKLLTIQEFIKSFTIYKRVMCHAFPQRHTELDLYMANIVDMSTRFGGFGFYRYHKSFSAKAASLLLNENIKLDWSKRDFQLFICTFAGSKAAACDLCLSPEHTAEFCPLALNVGYKPTSLQLQGQSAASSSSRAPVSDSAGNRDTNDVKGRPRVTVQGSEICNDFNDRRGCRRDQCRFKHVCLDCKKPDHSQGAPVCFHSKRR